MVTHKMAAYVVRLRVLPQDVSINAQKLLESITNALGQERPVRSSRNAR